MKLLIFTFAMAIALSSCYKKKASEIGPLIVNPCPEIVSYTNEIEPMINMSCNVTGCHDNTASAGYVLNTYASVSNNSTIIERVIKHESGSIPMPYNQPKLSDSLIAKFSCWIEQGTLNN